MHFDRKCAGGMTVNEYLNNRNTPGYPGLSGGLISRRILWRVRQMIEAGRP